MYARIRKPGLPAKDLWQPPGGSALQFGNSSLSRNTQREGMLMPLSRPTASCRTWRAFTLVELLVIMGTIGVLIGLLLPAVSKSRVQAKSVLCMSRLQQIGVAFENY